MPASEHVVPRCGVVVHPGKPGSREALAALRRATRRRGWPEPVVRETTADSGGAEQVGELLGLGVDRLVVVGGDGTVREVAAALSRSGATADRVALGVLPTGTANLWARTVGVHGQGLDAAADVALDGTIRDSDLAWLTLTRADGSTRTHDVAVVAGVGMDAEAFASVEEHEKHRLGWSAYFTALARRTVGRPTRLTVRVDGHDAGPEDVRTVLVGNCRVLPLGLPLMPSASMTDGRLDVLVVAPRSLLGWAGVAAGVATCQRGRWTGMRSHRAHRVVIDLDAPTAVQVDGDPVGDAVRLELGVTPGAVLVRTPAAAATSPSEPPTSEQLLADPSPQALAHALRRPGRWRAGHAHEVLVRDAFLSLRGAELTRFKSLVNAGRDHRDLEHLVYDVVDDEGARRDILEHIRTQAEGIDVPDLHVLSDIDDTLRCALHDSRYPRGTVYPGVIALYRALDAGHAADPGAPGDLTFVTARPMDPAGLIETHTRRGLGALGLPPHAVLSGTFVGLRTHDAMAGAKLENFVRFRSLMPETHVVFIGDSGQGDVEVGRRMLAADPDAVRLVLIHDVVATPQDLRDALRAEGIVVVDTPVGAAVEAFEAGLVSAEGVDAVAAAAERELELVAWDSAGQEAATRRLLEADLARADGVRGRRPVDVPDRAQP